MKSETENIMEGGEKYETIKGKKRGGGGKTTAKNEKRRRQKENQGKKGTNRTA